jgi:hypothetical protein
MDDLGVSRTEEETTMTTTAIDSAEEQLAELENNSKNFSATEYLNKLFPNEQSLGGLDEFLVKLKRRIRKVNEEILVAVRQQSSTGSRAKEDLSQAQHGIVDLSSRITEIKVKAEQSETKVQEICRDIKKLDYAKRHLTNTITAFRRLSMLMSAIQNLQETADSRDYRETANLLEAVNQLASHFESFNQIPKVYELRGQLSAIKSALRATIFDDFIHATARDMNELDGETLGKLTHACRVVEAIDPHVKDELVSRICNKEMSAYQQIFSTNEAPSTKLEKTERRYAWMKKLLTRKQAFWDVFPKSWEVSSLLCTNFCKITKAHLSETLDSQRDNLDVANLLKALHCTLDFEKELNVMSGGGEISLYVLEGEEGGEEEEDDDIPEDELTEAQLVKRKYETMKREKKGAGKDKGAKGNDPQMAKANTFSGSISSCFEAHLKCYVELEEKSLMETVDQLVNEEQWEADGGEESNVLASSTQVFLHIKKSLKRCSLLTKGQTLFDLSTSFQKVLQAYGARLIARLPRNAGNKPITSMATTTSNDWHVKFDGKEEKVVCLIMGTAEYCYDTVDSLGQSIANMLDKPFSNQIDMSQAQDDFSGVITTALSTLVLGLETRVDQALGAMVRINWATLDLVGDQSEYVNIFSSVLADSIPSLGSLLAQNNFRFLCDKFTASFIPRFYLTIYKCKSLSDSGTQQLLLDAQAIRTLLLDIPSLGNHSLPPSYSRTVTQEMSKAENLLKVILSPADAILSNFLALMPITAGKEMPQILELKGLNKAEQQEVLDEMHKRGLLEESHMSANASAKGISSKARDFNMPKFDKLKLKSDFMQFQGRVKESAKGLNTKAKASKFKSDALNKFKNKFNF